MLERIVGGPLQGRARWFLTPTQTKRIARTRGRLPSGWNFSPCVGSGTGGYHSHGELAETDKAWDRLGTAPKPSKEGTGPRSSATRSRVAASGVLSAPRVWERYCQGGYCWPASLHLDMAPGDSLRRRLRRGTPRRTGRGCCQAREQRTPLCHLSVESRSVASGRHLTREIRTGGKELPKAVVAFPPCKTPAHSRREWLVWSRGGQSADRPTTGLDS